MAGISGKALNFGTPGNKEKFNGIEQNNDFDINMYDAFYRNFDPQIGRRWQIDPKPDMGSEKILIQKLKYIHENPVRAGLCKYPEEYKYSSALLYKTGIDNPSTKLRGISYALS